MRSVELKDCVNWFFWFFFISGFCSVLYELVWLRLAMAQFGVTTAMVSIVLSVFMGGLGLGSWVSGNWMRRGAHDVRFPALRLYAIIELLIGVSGIVVPYELVWGRRVLENLSVSSVEYYFMAGLWVSCTLAPWCGLMGATIPVAMRAIGQRVPREGRRSFSFLYTANVGGAVMGTLLPLFLIEILGFRGTLKVGVACNILIGVSALALSRGSLTTRSVDPARPAEPVSVGAESGRPLLLLFMTGLTSMGMEVVWVRQFTPYLGTVVYAFAAILVVYLSATFFGSRVYRRRSSQGARENPLVWAMLALFALLPLLAASSSIVLSKGPRLVLGIMPFTGLLGYITPMLVDRFSAGDPGKAGRAYSINVMGCVLGPLIAGFGLLPWMSERCALVLLSLPWLMKGLLSGLRSPRSGHEPGVAARVAAYALLPLAIVMILAGKGYSEHFSEREVRRDSTATVIATGTGMQKQLLVNGYGMTVLTPATKTMAHLPLAFLDHRPEQALDICFGMGTTFRSLLTWNVHTTAVELVPSVPRLFGYFHGDASEVLRSPLAQVVIDDGRRYLERNREQYDIITIDPPPPVEAAGSSLLYSEEFYAMARKRLRPGGILQQWLPSGDAQDLSSVARALQDSFPYVRVFRWTGGWGFHFLASDHPLAGLTATELARRLPAGAAADFVEWGPESSAERQFGMILSQETSLATLIAGSPGTPAMRDDRPVNEYYVLRRAWR